MKRNLFVKTFSEGLKKIAILTTLTVFVVYGKGQTNTLGNFNKHVIEKWTNDYVLISKYRVKGSPYLLGEAFPGYIVYSKGGAVMDVKIFYDIYYQKVGMAVEEKMMEHDDQVREFMIVFPEKFGGDKLLFRHSTYFEHPEIKTYFNVLDDGQKLSFLKSFRSRLITDPTNPYSNDIKIFEQYYEYYIFNKDTKALEKVKLREKDILQFVENNGNIKEYLKQNYIDLTKEKDVIKFINQYNTGL